MGWITATDGDTGRPLSRGQKVVWAIGALIVALVIAGAFTDDEPARPPVGVHAECDTLEQLIADSGDMTTGEALGGLARLTQAAESGPFESHVGRLLAAVDSGESGQVTAAARSMRAACQNG